MWTKIFLAGAVATLLAACAAPRIEDGSRSTSRASSPEGEATAAMLGFHGPLHRMGINAAPD